MSTTYRKLRPWHMKMRRGPQGETKTNNLVPSGDKPLFLAKHARLLTLQ